MSRSKASEIKVTFDPFRCWIRIYRNTYRALGSPKHIQFLVNPEELYFAILGLDHPMRGGTSNKVPDYYRKNTQQSIEVYSTLMINQILDIVGQLSYDNIYQLAGDVDSNNRIAYFSLRTISVCFLLLFLKAEGFFSDGTGIKPILEAAFYDSP